MVSPFSCTQVYLGLSLFAHTSFDKALSELQILFNQSFQTPSEWATNGQSTILLGASQSTAHHDHYGLPNHTQPPMLLIVIRDKD